MSIEQIFSKGRLAEEAGKFADAERFYRAALEMAPGGDLRLHVSHAAVVAKLGDLSAAIGELEGVLERDRENVPALRWLSVLYWRAKRITDALMAHERIVELRPQDAEPLHSMGLFLLEVGRFQAAANALRKAIGFQPRVAKHHFALAAVLQRLDDGAGAASELRVCIELEPGNLAARKALIDCLMYFRRYDEVVDAARELLKIQPDNGSAKGSMAEAFHALERFDDAERHVREWLSVDRDNYLALVFNGGMHLEKGEFEAASSLFERAIEVEPELGGAYFRLVQCGSELEADGPIVRKMLSLVGKAGAPPQDMHQLQLALGKVFEDSGDYERSMAHYDQANMVVLQYMNATNPFHIRAVESGVEQAERLFTAEFFERHRMLGHPSDLPVLVIGMIRSGTTLTEQILASHPEVAGAGEQKFWNENGGTVSNWLTQMPSREESVAIVERYLALLHGYGPGSARVVDKMPGNFFAAGRIHTQAPNARFIHIRRNPVDTALSIWTTFFQSPPRFSASRANIVGMYRQYERLMAHWRLVLPADRFLEIDYEELVRDKEATIRRLIEFCGLEWSDSCLHPELRNSRVSTPSLARVRKPIDSSRVERWRRFEPWLGEFQELLAE